MKTTILVVEDYEDTRFLIKFELERRGYDVWEAADGREAIDLVRKDCPDLILMDLSLPVVDGLTATRLIHEMERCCRVPVVAVTAHLGDDYREKALQAGCADFLNKPIDFNQLERVVASQLASAEQSEYHDH